jgi:uncharacterized protein
MRAAMCGAIAVALISILPAEAPAQAGPSFDCSKATSPVEKAICADPGASEADRKMAAAYDRLLQSLTAPQARAHLQRDQVAWLSDRHRVCAPAPAEIPEARETAACLRDQADARAEWLALLPGGNDYPYVGERRLLEQGRRGGVPYRITVSYAAFGFHEVDYTRANAAIKAWVDEFAAHARPPAERGPGMPGIGWFLEAGQFVHVPSRELVTVAAYWTIYAGGAHPNHGRLAWHVELTTGRLLGLDDILDPRSGWREALLPKVRADLKKQFEERPGFEEQLEPAELGKALDEARRWVFTRDNVLLTFDPYEVGPYASGPYEVELSWATLAPYLRKDGPLASRAR